MRGSQVLRMDAGDAEPACVRLKEIGKQREYTLRLRLANEVHATAADIAARGELAPADDRDSLFLDEAAFHRLDVAEQDRQLRLCEHPQFRGRIPAGREGANLPPRGLEAFLIAFQKGLALLVVAHPCAA